MKITEIHGHEVMRMMLESGKAYSVESLRAAIVERFGQEARFHTCSQENMTAGELISFLADHGKFVPVPEGFSTSADKLCQH
jgi:probable metal-binding protein